MPDLVGWMERNSERLYLSVITVAGVEDGIAKAQQEGAHRKADRLKALHLYGARVLPLDIAAARLLGALSDQARPMTAHTGLSVEGSVRDSTSPKPARRR